MRWRGSRGSAASGNTPLSAVEQKTAGMIFSFRLLTISLQPSTSPHITMWLTGSLQSLWPVLPPIARACTE
jgi:hypothetical protein